MKYKIGEEVNVEFIGIISGVRFDGEHHFYAIRRKISDGSFLRAENIPESFLYPLPTAEAEDGKWNKRAA